MIKCTLSFHRSDGRALKLGGFAMAAAVPISAFAVDHILTDSSASGRCPRRTSRSLTDNSVWNSLKSRDTDLDSVIGDIYADLTGARQQVYGLCYAAGTLRGDPKTPTYAKKAVAILKTLARSFPVIAPNQNHQFLAFGDGSTKVFTLPMPNLGGTAVRVFTNTANVNPYSYTGATQSDVTADFSAGGLYPVLRISSTLAGATSNAAPEYVKELDWHVSFRDEVNGSSEFNVLHWLGANHPSGTYYVATNFNADDTELASGFSVNGTTLTFTTAPAKGKAVYVEYLGPDYTQTSNFYGAVESVKPDGPGYNMRAMNGLAYG